MGFGNAGVHIPHACAYPIAGMVRSWRPTGYPQAEPLVPHGFLVALTAPSAFRFTFAANPERQLRAAQVLDPQTAASVDPSDALSAVVTALMRAIEAPAGLAVLGYGEHDIDGLVRGDAQAGAAAQHRSPHPRPGSCRSLRPSDWPTRPPGLSARARRLPGRYLRRLRG